MAGTSGAALRYLPAQDLERCLPEVARRLDLCASALVAVARGDAEMPPKIGVHPRPGALLHAMPAWLRTEDLVGLKWVAAFPDNRRRGLPAIDGLVVLNDPDTGAPTWVMGAARITAVRTAAVSGVAIRLFAPPATERVVIVGAGVQARSHLEVIATVLPAAEAAIFDRHPERAAALADEMNADRGAQWVRPAADLRPAVSLADVTVTVATLGIAAERITPAWLKPGALVIAVDFATMVSPEVALTAARFAVDDRAQFEHYRGIGYFDGYPDPTTTLGDAASSAVSALGAVPSAEGDDGRPTLVTHLGIGLADVVLADAIRAEAEHQGAGMELPR